MKIQSANETENALFNRKEVEAIVESEVTPKTEEALELISEKYSMPKDNIKIKGVYGKFGTKEFRILAHVYKSKQDKEKIETKTKQEKEAEKKAEEDKAKAAMDAAKEKAAEEEKKEEEKPGEEKTEEVKE